MTIPFSDNDDEDIDDNIEDDNDDKHIGNCGVVGRGVVPDVNSDDFSSNDDDIENGDCNGCSSTEDNDAN